MSSNNVHIAAGVGPVIVTANDTGAAYRMQFNASHVLENTREHRVETNYAGQPAAVFESMTTNKYTLSAADIPRELLAAFSGGKVTAIAASTNKILSSVHTIKNAGGTASLASVIAAGTLSATAVVGNYFAVKGSSAITFQGDDGKITSPFTGSLSASDIGEGEIVSFAVLPAHGAGIRADFGLNTETTGEFSIAFTLDNRDTGTFDTFSIFCARPGPVTYNSTKDETRTIEVAFDCIQGADGTTYSITSVPKA